MRTALYSSTLLLVLCAAQRGEAMTPPPMVNICTSAPTCESFETPDLAHIAAATKLDRLQVVRVLSDLVHADLAPLLAFPNLEQLHVSLNGNGASTLSQVHGLKKLRALQINYVQGTELRAIAQLTQLSELRLRSLPDVTQLPALAKLTNLQWLEVSGSAITDLRWLTDLPALRTLRLTSNKRLVDTTGLGKLTRLEDLSLGDCFALATVPELGQLTTLHRLNLKSTQVTDLSEVAKLAQLEDLELWGTKVRSLTPLSRLPKLRSLNLTYTPVTDLSPLYALQSLRVVYVDARTVGEAEIAKLQKALPLAHVSK